MLKAKYKKCLKQNESTNAKVLKQLNNTKQNNTKLNKTRLDTPTNAKGVWLVGVSYVNLIINNSFFGSFLRGDAA